MCSNISWIVHPQLPDGKLVLHERDQSIEVPDDDWRLAYGEYLLGNVEGPFR